MSFRNQLLSVLLIVIIGSCKNEDPIPLIAIAGVSQLVSPQELVILDGSKSSGPGSLSYSWTYEGLIPESEIDFQNKNSSKPTFVAPKSGVYTFTLTIKSEGGQAKDQVTVTASGGLEIGGILTGDLDLKDIESNEAIPDYIVTSDLEVPIGLKLSVVEENVLVYFETGTGLKVSAGGSLTNLKSDGLEGYEVEFSGPETGWKGIWIENGRIELKDASVEYAGAMAFQGLSEAAALSFSGVTLMDRFSENTFSSSFSYDLKVDGQVVSNNKFALNEFSFKNPVKAPVNFLRFWDSSLPNVDPEIMEFHIMIPGGANIKDTLSSAYIFGGQSKYLLSDDFWAGENGVIVGTGSSLFFKEGKGLLSEGGFSAQGSSNSSCELKGEGGANWRGIVNLDTNGFTNVSYTDIDGAGNGLISIGGFVAEAPAFFYGINPRGEISNCTFNNIGGFGIYNADTVSESSFRVLSNDFNGLPMAAIRTNVESVFRLFFLEDEPNNFNMQPGVPAVLVQGTGVPTSSWYGLGGANFYFIDTHLQYVGSTSPWILQEGVQLVFRDGDYYEYDPGPTIGAANIEINGTAQNPVIFDSESGTPGSWGGIFLRAQNSGWWDFNYFIIRNGGGFVLPSATEKANMSVAYTGSLPTLINFTNSTVENSDGYGIVVEAGTIDYGYDDAGKNNTFLNNLSGNVLVK
jgi:K319L-like, PKD domain